VIFQIVILMAVLATINFAVYFLVKENIKIPQDYHSIILSLEGYEDEYLDEEYIKEEFGELVLKAMLTTDLFIFILVLIFSIIFSKKAIAPLEESFHRQKKFISQAAHELRTPLSVLKAGLEFQSGRKKFSEKK
jgi:signal transduction histidine kinase